MSILIKVNLKINETNPMVTTSNFNRPDWRRGAAAESGNEKSMKQLNFQQVDIVSHSRKTTKNVGG